MQPSPLRRYLAVTPGISRRAGAGTLDSGTEPAQVLPSGMTDFRSPHGTNG